MCIPPALKSVSFCVISKAFFISTNVYLDHRRIMIGERINDNNSFYFLDVMNVVREYAMIV